MDIRKQIDFWRKGSEEDLLGARTLFEKGLVRLSLFVAHLALEKMLKAHVAKATAGIPPKIHNLSRLGEISGLPLPPERKEFLNRFDIYQIQGRYPEDIGMMDLDQHDAGKLLDAVEEMIQWLKPQL